MAKLSLGADKIEERASVLRLGFEKKGVKTLQSSNIAFQMDVSLSFNDEHENGYTQGVVDVLMPWAYAFDKNKKADFYTFSDGSRNAYHVGEIDMDNYPDYIRRRVYKRVPGYNGGTTYSDVIKKTLKDFEWLIEEEKKEEVVTIVPEKKKSFWGSLFGGAENKPTPTPIPAPKTSEPEEAKPRPTTPLINLFVTDGEPYTSDEDPCRRVLKASQKRGDKVYFIFIGVNNNPDVKFTYLKQIAKEFDNTGFVRVDSLDKFLALSQEELNELLISDELVTWIK